MGSQGAEYSTEVCPLLRPDPEGQIRDVNSSVHGQ